MGKWQNDLMLDAALNYLKTNADAGRLIVMSSSANTYATASANKIAEKAMASGNFTLNDGDTNGRKVTVANASSITASATASANHIAITSSAGGSPALLYVTTCTEQSITTGNLVDVLGWDIEIADAT